MSATTPPPPHPSHRQSAFALRTPPLPVVRVGIVGLGLRGWKAAERIGTIPHARITALCDRREEILRERQNITPYGCHCLTDYQELCQLPDVDLVYICTDWASHTTIALSAMEQGKHVAIEVPAAITIADCQALVSTAERTQRHCTMLENCCYDSLHLATLAAARRGRMGTIVHTEGAYLHPIAQQCPPWRIAANQQSRGDLYPTHAMGPACQLLGIHRTDWIETLVSIDTATFARTDFLGGDHTTTLMRTRQGKTILLQHNIVCQHQYTRRYHVVGTQQSVEGSDSTPHDLMSLRMDRRLIYCLHHGLPLDIDVYDLAEWCAVTELSSISIQQGNQPVTFPKFL